MNSVQLRYGIGGRIEYRSRLMFVGNPTAEDNITKHLYFLSREWGPWREIDAVRGDETDAVRFGLDAE